MNKVININFHGRVIPIEEQAYDQLKQYIDQLNRFFAKEEGKDEIINDIESRIAELLADILKKGETCITTAHMNGVLASMGRPEEFETEEPTLKTRVEQEAKQPDTENPFLQINTKGKSLARSSTNRIVAGVCGGLGDYFNVDAIWFRVLAVIFFAPLVIAYLVLWAVLPERADLEIGVRRKRLFRDTVNGNVAGVAAGLASYFNIRVWIPRLIFLLPLIGNIPNWRIFDWDDSWRFSVGNGPLIIYVIMWILLPEARSASDRLQMKGEKVDFNSIKETVTGDLQRFQARVKANETLRNGGSSIAKVLETLVKVFLYIIVFSVLISIIIALFAGGIAGIGLMQYSNFLLAGETQSLLAWVFLICFFFVPVVGLIVWMIRRLTGSRGKSSILGFSFGALWTIGLIAGVLMVAHLSREFRRNGSRSEETTLSNPSTNALYVQSAADRNFWEDEETFDLEPFRTLNGDTLYAPNMRIEIVRSQDSAYHTSIQKLSNGPSREDALRNADFPFQVEQKDSVLLLPQGIPISPSRKFRNQGAVVQIAVPLGKKILVEGAVPRWRHVNISFGPDGEWNSRRRFGRSTIEQEWKEDVLYIMTAEGLRRADGSVDKDDEERDRNERLDEFRRSREQLEEDMQRKRQELEEMERELKKDSLLQPAPAKGQGGSYRYQQARWQMSPDHLASRSHLLLKMPTTTLAGDVMLKQLL